MVTTFTVPEADVIKWRRHLHANPELSNQEFETSAFVERHLRSFGLRTSRPTPTSVLGILTGTGETPSSTGFDCIALRADMDALPVQEETGLPFSSTVDGVMHACGHDTHTAMLLGTARTLVGLRNKFSGTVKFLFQHAEEKNPGGAKFMVEAGVLKGVDRVFGFHVMNGPKATVQVAKGNATSSAGGFFLKIQGVGSHGSMPHLGRDPILCASQVIVALNHIVARDVDPSHTVVVNAGFVAGGSAPNVIPDTAKLGCSIRTYTPEDAEITYRRADEVVRGICLAYGCTFDIDWIPPYDIVINDPAMADVALNAARKVLGEDKVSQCGPSTASEDFSEFTKVVPGAFVLINGGNAEDGLPYQNHHPAFNVREETLAAGVKTEVQIVLDMLGEG